MACDENESESYYKESKADTAQNHTTKDRVESNNTYDELRMFTIIHDRYGSIKYKISSSSSQGQGELDHVLGRICLTIIEEAVTLNIHNGYYSDSNSKGRCRNNFYNKYGLQLNSYSLKFVDTCDVNSDEERLGFLAKRYKFGHRRRYKDRDF